MVHVTCNMTAFIYVTCHEYYSTFVVENINENQLFPANSNGDIFHQLYACIYDTAQRELNGYNTSQSTTKLLFNIVALATSLENDKGGRGLDYML